MIGQPSEIVASSRRTRSRVTNGSRAVLFGDGRSAGARRYRDLIKDFAGELGDPKALPATSQQIVRRLAQVSVELELLEATRASGAAIDPLGFATLINSQRRLLRDFGALKAQPSPRDLPPITIRRIYVKPNPPPPYE